MPTNIHKLVTVSPAVWPGAKLEAQPGNLDLFLPQGIGLSGPMVVRPWDDLSDALSRSDYYAFERRRNHPLLDGPRAGATGGTVYFDGDPEQTDIAALLRLLRVYQINKKYVAFVQNARSPAEQNFLTQLRILSTWTLSSVFGISREEVEKLPEQPLTVAELIWKFIEDQREVYGTGYSHELSGCMGGDGDWAKETLAFGFMVENEYHGAYRLWSRAWLVTK